MVKNKWRAAARAVKAVKSKIKERSPVDVGGRELADSSVAYKSIKMTDPNNLKRTSSTSLNEDETPSAKKSKQRHQSSPAPTQGGTCDDLVQVSRSLRGKRYSR